MVFSQYGTPVENWVLTILAISLSTAVIAMVWYGNRRLQFRIDVTILISALCGGLFLFGALGLYGLVAVLAAWQLFVLRRQRLARTDHLYNTNEGGPANLVTQSGMSQHTFIRNKSGGFDLIDTRNGHVIDQVAWATVSRIETYKLDLLTTDCICMLFTVGDGEKSVEVSEECGGFDEMRKALEAEFPDIPGDWYGEVMQPPFETNHMILFDSRLAG